MWCNVNICLTIENNWLKYLLIIFTLKIPKKILSCFKIQLWEMKVFRICYRNASFTNLFYDTHAYNLIVGRNFMTRLLKKWISMELRRSCLVYQNENLTFDSSKKETTQTHIFRHIQRDRQNKSTMRSHWIRIRCTSTIINIQCQLISFLHFWVVGLFLFVI